MALPSAAGSYLGPERRSASQFADGSRSARATGDHALGPARAPVLAAFVAFSVIFYGSAQELTFIPPVAG
jgi:hypothetical protein